MAGNILAMYRWRRWCSSDRRAPARLEEPESRSREPGGPGSSMPWFRVMTFSEIGSPALETNKCPRPPGSWILAPGSFRRAGARTRAMLPSSITPLIEALKTVPGIRAIVVGGSRARGSEDLGSDTDLGLYYDPQYPLAAEALDQVVEQHDDRKQVRLGTAIGGRWGWIHGWGGR